MTPSVKVIFLTSCADNFVLSRARVPMGHKNDQIFFAALYVRPRVYTFNFHWLFIYFLELKEIFEQNDALNHNVK